MLAFHSVFCLLTSVFFIALEPLFTGWVIRKSWQHSFRLFTISADSGPMQFAIWKV
jgi:hypothetical protein